jgi:guanosine-3',5'-bis(diphosphate) 3'-pyrophosphohydrolase
LHEIGPRTRTRRGDIRGGSAPRPAAQGCRRLALYQPPLALADILAAEGGIEDAEVIAAALLHDTVEDTETTIEEVHEHFGERVAGIVAEVTDDKSLEKADRKRLQVEKAASKSEGAKLVKLADKTSNLRDILASPPAEWSDERKREYFEWARKVVDRLRGVHPRLEAAFDEVYENGLRAFSGKGAASSAQV